MQFSQMIWWFGWGVKFVDLDDLDVLWVVVDDDICVIFCELISNFGGYVIDILVVVQVVDQFGLLLIVDNMLVMLWLCKLIQMGVMLVVYSLMKYLIGNGMVMGGVVVDLGCFDWLVLDKFFSFLQFEFVYYGLKFYESFGNLVFIFYGIVIGLCDLGMMMNLQVVYYMLMGFEMLGLCMVCYVDNV